MFLPVALAMAQTPIDISLEPSTYAQEISVNRGSAALWQSLKKLHTRASMVMITAHPDDEDGGMLTLESRGRGTRVALLTLNRGEGGANVMSGDYFDALGLVRTEELLAAGHYYGVDQFWTRVIDYGFSKTMAESMDHWTRDRVLYDVVRIVRMVRPLVITSVFVGGPSDGHGNHQTAGAMAQAVFEAAGDPNVFPDQIRAGLRPWSPVKDYARNPNSGRGGVTPVVNVEVPEGEYDPVLGASYIQISREGLGYQKSQNGGADAARAGQTNTTYRRIASKIEVAAKEKDFFEGIDVSLAGMASLARGADAGFLKAGLARINAAVEDAMSRYSAVAPERCASSLATGMKETIALIAEVEKSGLAADSKYDLLHELNIKRVQFNSALAESLGLTLAANVAADRPAGRGGFGGDPDTFTMAIPGQGFKVRVYAVNQGPVPATLEHLSLEAGNGPAWNVTPASPIPSGEIAGGKPVDVQFQVAVPADAPFTRPYFSRPDIEQSYYDILDDRFLNRPRAPYALAAWADFRYEGAPIRIGQYVQTVKRVNGRGMVLDPLAVGPAIGVSISPRFGVVPLDAKSFEVAAVVHSNVKGPASGTLKLALPAGWKSEPASIPFSTTQDGEDRSMSFHVIPAGLSEKTYEITAVAEYGGKQYREGYEVTGYSGLRPYFLYTDSTYKATGTDVKVAPNLSVGYVMGSGDDVPASLENLGIKVQFLAAADIASGDLSKYDEIILGVRTYAARPELATYNNRLLDYVKNGGVVIVQYNTPEFDHNFGPYPYAMTSNPEEVTDEASKVEILEPSNPLLNWPNRITTKDFAGWVEERGSKWMKTWDPHYEALLETHDAGQEPQKGGLLYAKYGKGAYVYNAYAFYRELPAGVPGAFRIFANMLSLPRNPGR